MSERIKVTPINPFTKRQAEVVECIANGMSHQQTADKLGTSVQTIRNHVTGLHTSNEKGKGGIFGNITRSTGERPAKRNWIAPMFGDVLYRK